MAFQIKRKLLCLYLCCILTKSGTKIWRAVFSLTKYDVRNLACGFFRDEIRRAMTQPHAKFPYNLFGNDRKSWQSYKNVTPFPLLLIFVFVVLTDFAMKQIWRAGKELLSVKRQTFQKQITCICTIKTNEPSHVTQKKKKNVRKTLTEDR